MTPRINRNFVASPNAGVVRQQKKKLQVKSRAIDGLKGSVRKLKDLQKRAKEAQAVVDASKAGVENASLDVDMVSVMKSHQSKADKACVEHFVAKRTSGESLLRDRKYGDIGVKVVAALAYGDAGGMTIEQIAASITKVPHLAYVIDMLVSDNAIVHDEESGRYFSLRILRKNLSLRPASEEDDSDDSGDDDY
jgi:hypothetical protein